MNFIYVQLSLVILMFVAQDDGKMAVLTQQVKKVTLTSFA